MIVGNHNDYTNKYTEDDIIISKITEIPNPNENSKRKVQFYIVNFLHKKISVPSQEYDLISIRLSF